MNFKTDESKTNQNYFIQKKNYQWINREKKRQNFRISMMGKSPEGLVKGADELDALRLSCLTA